MIITKIYKAEAAHRVPGATTTRCTGVHGHSYKFEVSLKGSPINNACMVVDFSVLNTCVKSFVDSFDHSMMICTADEREYVEYTTKNFNRWIIAPFNWSCEMMSLMLFHYIKKILNNTNFTNGENPDIFSVKVWETATGSATCTLDDYNEYWNEHWEDHIIMSKGVTDDWTEELRTVLKGGKVDTVFVEKYMKMLL